MVRVSVVSVFYNRAGMVDESVASLKQQSLDDYEILLVDDGSTDNTLERLRAHEDAATRVIAGPNRGLVGALNKAIAEARGAYIAIHGSGDLSLPQRLARQAEILDQRPEVGVVGCRSEVVTLQSTRPPHLVKQAFDGDARETIIDWNPFHHGEVMFRKTVFDQVGGYRPFFVCAQDRDLWCRMSHHCHFLVLEDVLYRKFAKVPGSVAADPGRLMLQRHLSDFALYCHRERLAGRPDPLEQFGEQGALFRPPSRDLAKDMCVIGSRYAADGNLEAARTCFRRARDENGYLPARLLLAAATLTPGILLGAGDLWRKLLRLVQKARWSEARR
ncbi:glycosyltransferase [Marinobacter sp.]|uniref:glycosyltransferase n=1 Tax=Marinobacter sp. TaxID=50741 RepID=UPI0035641B14